MYFKPVLYHHAVQNCRLPAFNTDNYLLPKKHKY